MFARNSDFARLAALRQVVKADLVMVMAHWTYDGNCGRGWQLDNLDTGATSLSEAAKFGISVISEGTIVVASTRMKSAFLPGNRSRANA